MQLYDDRVRRHGADSGRVHVRGHRSGDACALVGQPQSGFRVERRAGRHALARALCHDPDVPSRGDDVNQEGRVVPASLPRVDFFHWVLIDLPPVDDGIARGAHSDGVVAARQAGPAGAAAAGATASTTTRAGSPPTRTCRGDYYGYDGPCPPWNDAIAASLRLHALRARRADARGGRQRSPAREARAR